MFDTTWTRWIGHAMFFVPAIVACIMAARKFGWRFPAIAVGVFAYYAIAVWLVAGGPNG